MSKTTLVLIAGFIAGCGAAVVAPMIIPPAHAQSTQRWEVLCQQARVAAGQNPAESFTGIGNQAGQQAWEPFSANDGVICFKRPAP